MAARGAESTEARAALAQLCEIYWYPLYAFVRRWGTSPDDARDLTQSFLTSLLERRDFENLQKERGRFRAFLLASLKHFLANDAARRHTQKRGGELLPLTFDDAEGRYRFEPADSATPESLYERRWALTVMERVLAHLRKEWQASGRGEEFDQLKACLLGETPDGGYAAVAAKFNTTEGAVRTSIHRLRRKFQARLRHDISQTVSDPADVDDEMRYLIQALNGTR
jgi:RNA polymerase sigma factor (sigma-70 family)